MTQAFNLSQLGNKVNTSGQLDSTTGLSGTIPTTNLPTIPVSKGGTGLTSLTANNVILGNGSSNPNFVSPSTSGNVLTSNGTTWVSTAPSITSGSQQLAKAWVSCNSTTGVIFSAYNVSSVSGGQYAWTVNFTSALADNNYACVTGSGVPDGDSFARPPYVSSQSTTSISFTIAQGVLNRFSLACFR